MKKVATRILLSLPLFFILNSQASTIESNPKDLNTWPITSFVGIESLLIPILKPKPAKPTCSPYPKCKTEM